jgi:hypothetical protein
MPSIHHHFSCSSQLEKRAPFGVSVITHTIRHTVGLLWTSDQHVSEASTYTGQHNIVPSIRVTNYIPANRKIMQTISVQMYFSYFPTVILLDC